VGFFSKQIPLNSDSSLGPVTIGSKIMVERGKDPLPLEGGNVELAPGSGWDGSTVTISKEMNPARNKLDILVKLAPEISLAHYLNVIVKKKPIKLKVTLFPRMLVPGMGVSVNVSAAPVTDNVDVTIPGVPQPDIDLDVKFTGKTSGGSYTVLVTALVKLPPYISKKDREGVVKTLTIDIQKPKNVTVEKGALSPDENGAACDLIATPDFTSKTGTPTVTIVAKASLPGILLKKEKQVSFEPLKTYVLNIHPANLNVTRKKPGSFIAQVLEDMPDGQRVLLTDARLSIDGGSDLVSCSPGQGTGKLECKVSQQKVTGEKQVVLTVHATADNDSVKPQNVTVNLETIDYGNLEVVFVPAAKNHLNPYIKTDQVLLHATLVPPPGKPPVKAEFQFACENPAGWLDGPKDYALSFDPNSPSTGPADTTETLPFSDPGSEKTAGDGENAKTIKFTGRIPDPELKQVPPATESVVVKAIVEGTVVDEKPISVTLDPKPTLTADLKVVNFLANAKRERVGRPQAITSAPIRLSVINPGGGEWKISVECAEKKLVSWKEQDKSPSSEVFLFEICDDIPLPEKKHRVTLTDDEQGPPVPDPWQQVVTVTTSATLGDLKIDGEPITINLLHEGIYPDLMYESDKTGELKPVHGKENISINVIDPAEERAQKDVTTLREGLQAPYVTFIVMEWNGSALARNEDLVIEAERDIGDTENYNQVAHRSVGHGPEGKLWDFIFFTLKESLLEVVHDGDSDKNTGNWHILLLKQIPGHGEKANGFVRFFVKEYYYWSSPELTPNWKYDLPIHLILGVPDELNTRLSYYVEGARCRKIIDECFPEKYRGNLWKELEELHDKGAEDYRAFSKQLHETAWEIWKQDQQDYLVAETAWSGLIIAAEGAEFVGDLAFNALVMVYTAPLGPVSSLGLSMIVSEIKAESIGVYSYYVQQNRHPDLSTCIVAYIDNHWIEFITSMAVKTPAELFILRNFEFKELIKQPRKYGPMIAWLWLWKFSVHLKEDGKEDGGFINSATKATKEIGELLLTVALAKFVEFHGSTDLKNLYGRVKSKGFFGGTEVTPGTPEKDPNKADKEKPPDKDKTDKDPNKPDKEKPPDKDKTDKDPNKTDKEKPPDKDKTDKDPNKTDKEKPTADDKTGKKGKPVDDHAGTPLGQEYRKFTYEDAPGADIGKLTRGMTDKQIENVKKICAEENVDILTRSTTPYAEELIRTGKAEPKPEHVKTKTINENDLKLNDSLTCADLGKAGYFEPKEPTRDLCRSGKEGDAEFADLQSRYKQRKQEVLDQKTNIEDCKNLDASSGKKIVVENGKVKKVRPDGTTVDITGDPDIMAVNDHATGEPVKDPVKMARIYKRVQQEMGVQHPWQSQWDYRNASKTVPEGSAPGTQSEYVTKYNIDQKIIKSHMKDNPDAEPLINFSPDGKVTGKYITGVSEP